jgi:predicted permease
MRRNPAVAAVVVLSLALGIGANTAIFSLVNAMALRDLPVTDPARLLALQYIEPKDPPPELDHSHSGRSSQDSLGRSVGLSISWPSFAYLREHTRTLAPLAGFVPLGMFNKPAAVVNGEPMFLEGDMVTAGYFRAAGVSPIRGRLIQQDDEKPDAARVGVISERLWDRAYARNADAVGGTITLNGVPLTIVGVLPSSFTGLDPGRASDIWIQMGPRAGLLPWGNRPSGNPEAVYAAPDWWWIQAAGRLAPGVTPEQARAEVDRLFRESLLANIASAPPPDKLPVIVLSPASAALRVATINRRYLTSLRILMVVGSLVLLIACANVATLLLARATARQKEMGVRLALGAPRARLVRQLLTESGLYAAAGAALGLSFAAWGGRALLTLLTEGRDPLAIDVTLDPLVLAFTAIVSVLTTGLFGLAPAFRATRIEVAAELKENAATSAGSSRARRLGGGKLLVVAQLAMALPLVIGAGLFLRTLTNLSHQSLGFDPDRILTFSVDPTKAGLKDARLVAAYGEIQERVRALPGVRAVTASELGLITGWVNNGTASVDGDGPGASAATRRLHWNTVGAGFFETMGMTIVLGRGIAPLDTADGPRVAVVNESLARQFFPGRHPLGQRFWAGRTRSGPPFEVVGVVRDAKYASLRAPAPATAYIPLTQSRNPLSAVVFEVRTAGEPTALANGVRKAVADVVPGVPIGNVKTQRRLIDDSLGQETMYARLFAFFGIVALVLACIGLYGTMTYALGRRTREIGIRMALGAARGRVLGSALAEALGLAVAGLVGGGLLAWAGARFIRSLLFEVTPLDAPTLATAAAIMLLVALGAGFLPARRAARLDPLKALREE